MIELIIVGTIGIVHVIGIIIIKKFIKDKPECVSNCCNIINK